MTNFFTLDDVDAQDKTVLVRLDLNVPIQDRRITDYTRIDRCLPTLKALTEKGAKVVILSHLGRPKGIIRPEFSLAIVANALSESLGQSVRFAAETESGAIELAIEALQPGDVMVLENLRFFEGEELNDAEFSEALAKLGDIYVNDAFSVSHRAHASVEGVTNYLPAIAGKLMEEELSALTKALGTPQRPVMAIVGGAKVSTKVDLLVNLISKVDQLVIGGGMANTFLLAQGKDIAKSFCDRESVPLAIEILEKAEAAGCNIILPTDAVVAEKLEAGVSTKTVSVDAVPAGAMILDIGPESAAHVVEQLSACKTCVWNGPMGVFEVAPFDAATTIIAKAAADLTAGGSLLTVAGGGDTVAALNQTGVADQFTYLSTAGGAFLEWLEGKTLPGVAALERSAAAGGPKTGTVG